MLCRIAVPYSELKSRDGQAGVTSIFIQTGQDPTDRSFMAARLQGAWGELAGAMP
jgi:hypothetical protein